MSASGTGAGQGSLRDVRGLSLLEVVVGAAMLALVVSLAVPRYTGFIARRELTNAAFLVLNDLRLAHEAAAAQSGDGPRVEVCFHATGYTISRILFDSDIDRTGALKGPIVKAARAGAGRDYSAAVAMTPVGGAACLGEEGTAVGFRGDGSPDPAASAIELTHANGMKAHVDIEPYTGLATLRR